MRHVVASDPVKPEPGEERLGRRRQQLHGMQSVRRCFVEHAPGQ
jgi:hypothetical protein